MARHVECDDQRFVELVGEGGAYDYELGERYVVAPAAGGRHGRAQSVILSALLGRFGNVWPAANLGALGEPGRRWYVVPDVVLIPEGADLDARAYLDALMAVEVRSAVEDRQAKLALIGRS